MAKVYVITHERTDEHGNIRCSYVNRVYKTLDSARSEIEKMRDEYRTDITIAIIGESWNLGDYPYYEASYIEKYYLETYGEKRIVNIEYNIEEHELAD